MSLCSNPHPHGAKYIIQDQLLDHSTRTIIKSGCPWCDDEPHPCHQCAAPTYNSRCRHCQAANRADWKQKKGTK